MKHIQTAIQKLHTKDLDAVETELHALERICRSYLRWISSLEKALEKATSDNSGLLTVAVQTERANTVIQESRSQDHRIVQQTIETLNERDQSRMVEIEGLKAEIRELTARLGGDSATQY